MKINFQYVGILLINITQSLIKEKKIRMTNFTKLGYETIEIASFVATPAWKQYNEGLFFKIFIKNKLWVYHHHIINNSFEIVI